MMRGNDSAAVKDAKKVEKMEIARVLQLVALKEYQMDHLKADSRVTIWVACLVCWMVSKKVEN